MLCNFETQRRLHKYLIFYRRDAAAFQGKLKQAFPVTDTVHTLRRLFDTFIFDT